MDLDCSSIVLLIPYDIDAGWTYRAMSDTEWGVYDDRGDLRDRTDAFGPIRA